MRSTNNNTVTATLNYINPVEAPLSPKESLQVGLGNATALTVKELLVGKQKVIRNGRTARFHLKKDGFELLQGVPRPPYSDLSTDSKIRFYAMRRLMVPLANKIAKDRLGLTPYHVHFSPPLMRRACRQDVDTRDHNSGTAPHAVIHNDYAFDGYQQLQNAQHGGVRDPIKVRQQFQRAGRIVVLQFWMNAQPEGTVIENDTLALCHPRSIQVSDLVTRHQHGYNGVPVDYSILHAKDSSCHEWFYWPSLRTDECLVWVGYDSAWGDNVTPCFHTSFHDDAHSSNSARPRESIECRVILLLDEKQPQSRL